LWWHAALLEILDALFYLSVQHRQGDDVIVYLGNDFINNLRFTFLCDYRRLRQGDYRQDGQQHDCERK
jgi:hypothetical protein